MTDTDIARLKLLAAKAAAITGPACVRMTLREALALSAAPHGYTLVIDKIGEAVYGTLIVNGEKAGEVVSEPFDPEAFERALVQIIRSRFDASYDECEWQPRAAGGRDE